MKIKKMKWFIGAAILSFVVLGSCSLFNFPDVIEGNWQQVSVNGVDTVLLTVASFGESTYSVSVAGVDIATGTWTKSFGTYTLNGSFLGFLGTTVTFSPDFSNSRNTMTFTDSDGYIQIYNRQ